MDTDANVRQAAAEALVRLGVDAKPAVAMLVESLGAKSDAEQIRAARALGLLGPLAGDSGVVLVPLLGEQKTRAEAAKALGRIGRPTVPLLIKALDSKNALMRLGAAEALEQVGADAADAIPALSARVRTDSSASVREAAERTLKKIKR
jgi:HEAT repeat protein